MYKTFRNKHMEKIYCRYPYYKKVTFGKISTYPEWALEYEKSRNRAKILVRYFRKNCLIPTSFIFVFFGIRYAQCCFV